MMNGRMRNSTGFLNIAKALSQQKSEPGWRTAASRAYYASYHRCLEWELSLPAQGDPMKRQGVHAQLISRLLNPSSSCSLRTAARSRRIGEHLARQRDLRTKADYNVDKPLSLMAVQVQLRLADLVFADCALALTQAQAQRRSSGRSSGR